MSSDGVKRSWDPSWAVHTAGRLVDRTDADLLDGFARANDESSFAALIERHGQAIFRTCRTILGDRHDAEDAFQATYLLLAREACRLRVACVTFAR